MRIFWEEEAISQRKNLTKTLTSAYYQGGKQCADLSISLLLLRWRRWSLHHGKVGPQTEMCNLALEEFSAHPGLQHTFMIA
jgi:hypothetical protein